MKYYIFLFFFFPVALFAQADVNVSNALNKDSIFSLFYQKKQSNVTINVYKKNDEVYIISENGILHDTIMYNERYFSTIINIGDILLEKDRFIILHYTQGGGFFLSRKKENGFWSPTAATGLLRYNPYITKEARLIDIDTVVVEEAGKQTFFYIDYDKKTVEIENVKRN